MATPHPDTPPSDEWDHFSAVPRTTALFGVAAPRGNRRFASLTRTPTPQGFTVLDAIDADGRAWWLVLGDDAAPDDWTELQPLPSREEQS